MKPIEIARLLSEDVRFNNGLLFEDVVGSFNSAVRQFKSIDGPITVNDDDYEVVNGIYESQKAQINTVLGRNPKLLKGISALNDLAFSKWVSEGQVADSSRQFVKDVFKEEEITIDNIIWDYDGWKTVGNSMLERLSATDVRRFGEWSKGIDLFKGVLREIQALQGR